MSYFTTPPLPIEDLPADSHHAGGAFIDERFIIFHASAGKSSGPYLSTTPGSNVSCNRLIARSGHNFKIVPDGQNAWTQGYGVMGPYGPPGTVVKVPVKGGWHEYTLNNDINMYCLSIEFENLNDGKEPYTDAQLTAGAWQVIEWRGLYGDIPLLTHAQIDTRKNDPFLFPWQRYWVIYFQQLSTVLGARHG